MSITSKTKAPHLSIWRDAQAMLVWAEVAVRRFSRYHKYTVGAQLRTQAMQVCKLVLRAQATQPATRGAVVTDLHLAAEELKVVLQLGTEIQAFKSWTEFEQGVQLALGIARQAQWIAPRVSRAGAFCEQGCRRAQKHSRQKAHHHNAHQRPHKLEA